MDQSKLLAVISLLLLGSLILFQGACAPSEETQEAEVTELAGYSVVSDIKERAARFAPFPLLDLVASFHRTKCFKERPLISQYHRLHKATIIVSMEKYRHAIHCILQSKKGRP